MDPQRLYDSPEEWAAHEDEHRRVWHCDLHGLEFATRANYVQHLKRAPRDHTAEEQSEERVTAAIGPTKVNRHCPFCPAQPESVDNMQEHIKLHLEKLALGVFESFEEEHTKKETRRPLPTQRRAPKDCKADKNRDLQAVEVIRETVNIPREAPRRASKGSRSRTDGKFLCLLAAYTGCDQTFAHASQAKRHVEQYHILHEYWLCTIGDCKRLAGFQHAFLDPDLEARPFFRPDNYKQHLIKKHEVHDRGEQKRLILSARVCRCPLPSKLACPAECCSATFRGGKPLTSLFVHIKNQHADELGTLGHSWENSMHQYLVDYKILVEEGDGKTRPGSFLDVSLVYAYGGRAYC